MTRSALACALLLAAACVQAEDGLLTLSLGADYSTGDYDGTEDTTIFSVPFTAKYSAGAWTWKASLPWTRVDGDPNVLPGLGNVPNGNPSGRGRGRGNGGGGGGGEPVAESGSASGIGDLRLTGTYAFDTGGPLGVDLSAHVKVATADEDKGLGTGEHDFGLSVDLFGEVGGTLLFGGVSYTILGESEFIDVDSVAGANVGLSRRTSGGIGYGAVYDWREAATDDSDDRSELTGFITLPAGERRKWQVYALKGLSDGSPDWGGGASFSLSF